MDSSFNSLPASPRDTAQVGVTKFDALPTTPLDVVQSAAQFGFCKLAKGRSA
ncbi:hypothetical protein [Nocardia carnea]|uniref:hypothetical protein n=1 Tax=Nocardia carnea TaxID=37328 RepID=UPI00245511FA|nr:hypothetical protein [Nocardia carnea]